MLDVRLELAQINGFDDDYLSYRWTQLQRTDYTPADSAALHQALRQHWSPLYAGLMAQRRDALNLESVRPWDIHVPLNQIILKPAENAHDLLQKTINVFRRMDPDFGAYVEKLRDMNFIDLADRAHTASVGGFSRAIGRHGNFIFLNLEDTHQDVLNIVHEIGHALSLYASCQQPYHMFWGFPDDFSETPSSIMEVLTQPYWDEYYTPEDAHIARQQYARSHLHRSLEECVHDAFQHWLYQNLDEARDLDTCEAHWYDLTTQYLPGVDWSGLETGGAVQWGVTMYLPLHALEYFYGRMAGMILAALPADEAHNRYKTAISYGSSRPVTDLFAAPGMAFPVTEQAVREAASDLKARL